MRSLALAPALVLCLALPLSLACRPTVDPATEGTTYRITGVVAESACSPGLEAPDPLVYDVQVRSTGPIVYWRLGRNPWVPGSLAADGTFRISTRAPIEVTADYPGTDPDFDPPRMGCTLYQTETIAGRFVEPPENDGGVSDGGDAASAIDAGVRDDASVSDDSGAPTDASTAPDASTLDAGPPDPTAVGALEGENTIEISIAPGSDCTALLVANGGSFPSLPCVVRYTISGSVRD